MIKSNNIADLRVAAHTVGLVASGLMKRGDTARARELRVIAQYLGDGQSLGDGQPADQGASQTPDSAFPTAPQGSASFDPSQESLAPRDGQHPGIAPFAKQKGMTDPRMIHTVSMTLTAPPEVAETDMLNYILGMRDKLGVDATNVQWSKKEQKPQAVS